MFDFNTKKSPPKKRGLKPAEYTSHVNSVAWAPGYREGDAFEVCYTLTNSDGEAFPYKELFYCNGPNNRTEGFYDYLAKHGINSIEAFVGCNEKLTILKRVKDNRTFLTIDHREFLGSGGTTVVP